MPARMSAHSEGDGLCRALPLRCVLRRLGRTVDGSALRSWIKRDHRDPAPGYLLGLGRQVVMRGVHQCWLVVSFLVQEQTNRT